jgi:hypothetical protein
MLKNSFALVFRLLDYPSLTVCDSTQEGLGGVLDMRGFRFAFTTNHSRTSISQISTNWRIIHEWEIGGNKER